MKTANDLECEDPKGRPANLRSNESLKTIGFELLLRGGSLVGDNMRWSKSSGKGQENATCKWQTPFPPRPTVGPTWASVPRPFHGQSFHYVHTQQLVGSQVSIVGLRSPDCDVITRSYARGLTSPDKFQAPAWQCKCFGTKSTDSNH